MSWQRHDAPASSRCVEGCARGCASVLRFSASSCVLRWSSQQKTKGHELSQLHTGGGATFEPLQPITAGRSRRDLNTRHGFCSYRFLEAAVEGGGGELQGGEKRRDPSARNFPQSQVYPAMTSWYHKHATVTSAHSAWWCAGMMTSVTCIRRRLLGSPRCGAAS